MGIVIQRGVRRNPWELRSGATAAALPPARSRAGPCRQLRELAIIRNAPDRNCKGLAAHPVKVPAKLAALAAEEALDLAAREADMHRAAMRTVALEGGRVECGQQRGDFAAREHPADPHRS